MAQDDVTFQIKSNQINHHKYTTGYAAACMEQGPQYGFVLNCFFLLRLTKLNFSTPT